MTQIVWGNAPNRQSLTAVDAGVVVLVRINPATKTAVLKQDANGVPPHLVFIADVAPRGTNAKVARDVFDNVAEVGERPTAQITDQLSIDVSPLSQPGGQAIEFLLDVGRAFLCPVSGTIAIEGGAFSQDDGGATPTGAYEINIQTIMPQEVEIGMPWDVTGHPILDRRCVQRMTGEYVRRRPTMTYLKVGTTPVQIPRGAVDVQVNATQNVDFNLGGNPPAHATGTLNLSVPAGPPMPLGFLSQGTFNSHGGTIDWISFGIEVG